MEAGEQSFLGTGWTFPPTFSRINHSVQMSSALTDIEQSLHILLGTLPGERLMQPEFGCNLISFVFQQVDAGFLNAMNDKIRYAILMFEPRVNFEKTEVTYFNREDGILYISIQYRVIKTNTRHNIVYPFYLQEGTNLPHTI